MRLGQTLLLGLFHLVLLIGIELLVGSSELLLHILDLSVTDSAGKSLLLLPVGKDTNRTKGAVWLRLPRLWGPWTMLRPPPRPFGKFGLRPLRDGQRCGQNGSCTLSLKGEL